MSSGEQRDDPSAPADLDESEVDPDPIRQFALWFEQALKPNLTGKHGERAGGPEPTAMTLATATADGSPSARIVLLKAFDDRGFVFFTNYESDKARELDANPRAAIVVWWSGLDRQVRITGRVSRTSEAESADYFRTRPLGSKLGAWASPQSRVIAGRAELERRVEHVMRKYPDEQIPLPPFWGGYRVEPLTIEFWQGRESRLHDRLRYTKQPNGSWKIERLAP